MKLVTWNVNSLKVRLPRVLELLEEHRPDLVFMQETKTEPDAFPHAELAAAGDAGTLDAFRELHPDDVGFTWWDYRQGHFHRKMGLRIDVFLVSRPLAERLVECGIDRSYRKGPKPSDHARLLLELA